MAGRIGRLGVAPCGHSGETIVGQYYRCLAGCDASDPDAELELLIAPTCPNPMCGRADQVDLEFEVDPLYYHYNPTARIVDTRCLACGACWGR